MNRQHILWKFLLIGLIILTADAVTKWLTQLHIPLMDHRFPIYPYGGIGVFKNVLGIEFSISYLQNTGAAWGQFSNYQVPLLILRCIFIAGLVGYLFFVNKHPNRQIPLILIISGAIGNVIDYFVYGYVIDMFHFILWGYDFPVFNVADAAISIGIIWFLFTSTLESDVEGAS
jgi:signal peptidase II